MGDHNTVQFITSAEKTQQAACGDRCYLSISCIFRNSASAAFKPVESLLGEQKRLKQ